ncbi:MAG: peptide chain release factor-like protein [Victivallaceae bacterium]|nr:peptide chain release factor-like protein [Victivallaceae bacterium]
MKRDDLLTCDDNALLAECRLDFFKATGKGGQKRNKTSSAVRLIHVPTGIQAADCSERSQLRNRINALKKLRYELAFKLREPPGEPPEIGSLRPIDTARLFDLFDAVAFDHAAAAAQLGVSPSKLLKTMSRRPAVFAFFNECRVRRGLSVLHA